LTRLRKKPVRLGPTARQANLFRVAVAKYSWYACKIEETTNGGRRSPCGQARETVEVITARRIEKHVQIDESKRTQESGQDQAKKFADPKT